VAAGCSKGPEVSTDNRNAARMLLCATCGFAEEATGEAIQQRYAEGRVRPGGPHSPWFGCSGCGETAACLVVVDLSFSTFACSHCGLEGPRDAAEVIEAARGGHARLTANGAVQLRCPSCQTFTSVQRTDETPEPEKVAP
jgi:hypothetical protein